MLIDVIEKHFTFRPGKLYTEEKNNQYRMCTFMHSIMFGTVFIATQIHFWEMFVMFVKYCTVFRVIRQSKAGKIHIYSELLTGSIASERWRQLL